MLVVMKSCKILLSIGALILAVGFVFRGVASSQGELSKRDTKTIAKGRTLFYRHCAACHGNEAKGDGPVAAELKKQPADLTVIQTRGEKFPIYRIMTWIDGERAEPVHGPREMPIWGKTFRRAKGEAVKQSEIYALAKYLEAIQTYHQ